MVDCVWRSHDILLLEAFLSAVAVPRDCVCGRYPKFGPGPVEREGLRTRQFGVCSFKWKRDERGGAGLGGGVALWNAVMRGGRV